MKTSAFSWLLILPLMLAVSACALFPQRDGGVPPRIDDQVSAAVGALAPDRIDLDGVTGAQIGAVLGSVLPGSVHRYRWLTRQRLREGLADAIEQDRVRVESIGDDALLVELAGDASFASGSAAPKPASRALIETVADALHSYRDTVVHVVGFTDNRGSARLNKTLSRKRALAVADALIADGIRPARVLAWARGETQPIASNATAAGRARNRRTDLFIRLIRSGEEKQAFSAPPPLGRDR